MLGPLGGSFVGLRLKFSVLPKKNFDFAFGFFQFFAAGR
jgi:hypothetical protein